MRFTGQVRVPEVDHPGVPAIFVVEDDQAEVLLDGESLGRWSLFDVHASRLVSAAFSVSLAGDEITFIADEPVDFAYKGVDHMAESWARYKAMTLPRRMVAVGRSRRGTRPSRVTELRDAMLENLENQSIADWAQEVEEMEAAANAPTAVPPAPPASAPPPPPAPAPARPPLPPARTVPVVPPVEVSTPPIEEPTEATDAPVEPVETVLSPLGDETTKEVRSLPVRPGPGLVGRHRAEASAPAVPEVDPVDIFRPEPSAVEAFEPEPVGMELNESVDPEPPEIVEPEPIDDLEPAAAVEPEPVAAAPELIRELSETSEEGDREQTPERLVVDLGAYEVPSAPDTDPFATQPRVPALAAAAPVQDKSGIFGAVRAAFVRNKGSHTHEFVEAPGGIGIHRNICSECGYISIGVTESESE